MVIKTKKTKCITNCHRYIKMINNFLIRDTNAFNDRVGGVGLFALKKRSK